MQIILMRHGKPELDLESLKQQKVSARQVGEIVASYEFSGLSSTATPTEAASTVADECSAAFSSDLKRATDSIQKLGIQAKTTYDDVFREPALPYLNLGWPKFSFFTYCILFRVLWFLGFSANGESYNSAKRRARTCAKILRKSAKEEGRVLLLGQGMMNRLIARELRGRGWYNAQHGDDGYWSFTVFRK